jgi:hypothetical protein
MESVVSLGEYRREAIWWCVAFFSFGGEKVKKKACLP